MKNTIKETKYLLIILVLLCYVFFIQKSFAQVEADVHITLIDSTEWFRRTYEVKMEFVNTSSTTTYQLITSSWITMKDKGPEYLTTIDNSSLIFCFDTVKIKENKEAFCSNDKLKVDGEPYIKRIAPLDTFYMSFKASTFSFIKGECYRYTPKILLMKYYFREDIEKKDVIYIHSKHQKMVGALHIMMPRIYTSNEGHYSIIRRYNAYFDANPNDRNYYDKEYLKSFQMVCKMLEVEVKDGVP